MEMQSPYSIARALLCTIVFTGSAAAEPVTVGGIGGANLAPFGHSSYTGEYQQVYAASAFTGPLSIARISFFFAPEEIDFPRLLTSTFDLRLSVTSAGPTSMSDSYAANMGGSVVTVFSGSLSANAGNGLRFDIPFVSPFAYDPSRGNLLLDAFIFRNDDNSKGFIFGVNPLVGRVFNLAGSGESVFAAEQGLLTEFTASAATTPEPSALILVSTGVVGLLRVVQPRRGGRRVRQLA